ncbi:MAG: DUF1045 domain-containing protein [Paracoccaceae bacterium]
MSRFAIYCLPGGSFGAQGAAWLGWDARRGKALPVPEGRAAWVATPRRYGFHATLKAPFRLADGHGPDDLARAVADLAATLAPARVAGLRAQAMGRFAAFGPVGDPAALDRVAAACVTTLDRFRAPPAPQELARRRGAGLTPRQDALLTRWGYPHVLDAFRFHVTLSGAVEDVGAVLTAADAHFDAPAPFALDALALCEEGADGRFRLRHRYPLTGTDVGGAGASAGSADSA